MTIGLPIHSPIRSPTYNPIVGKWGGVSTEYQVIMAAGQSNMGGRQTIALGGSLISPDDDQHPRVYKYTGTGTLALVTMPIVFPDGATYDATVTPAFAYAKLVAAANPSSKIVILPFAVGGTGIDEWVAGSAEFDAMATAWSQFRAEFPSSALHSVVVSNLEHEMAAGTANATVATLLDNMIAAHRALPGASSVPIYIRPPVPEWVTSEDEADILLEGAKAAVRNSNVGIIGGVVAGGGLAGDGNLHYANAANRTSGAKYYAQINTTAYFQSNAPAQITVHGLTLQVLTFTSVGAPYYDIQTSPVGAGTWTSFEWAPNQDNSSGQSLSLTLPGSGSRDYRIIATSKGGSSTPSSVGTYSAAAAFLARWSVPATPTRATLIETFFNATGVADAMAEMDFLDFFAVGEADQSMLLNMLGVSFTPITVGGVTLTPSRDVVGNGTTGYLNLKFNPISANGKAQAASAHQGIWSRTAAVQTVVDMGARAAANTDQASFQLRTTADAMNARLCCDTSPASGLNIDASGHFVSRFLGTSFDVFRNAVSIRSSTHASSPMANLEWFLGSLNSGGAPSTFATREYAMVHGGSGALTNTLITNFYTAAAVVMTTIGA